MCIDEKPIYAIDQLIGKGMPENGNRRIKIMEPGENLYMGGGILRRGDRVGLSCCSNGLLEADKGSLELLKERLALIGLEAVESPFLYRGVTAFSGTGTQRAHALMDFYRDETVKAVFDVSGGDMANEVLTDLDFEMIDLHLITAREQRFDTMPHVSRRVIAGDCN